MTDIGQTAHQQSILDSNNDQSNSTSQITVNNDNEVSLNQILQTKDSRKEQCDYIFLRGANIGKHCQENVYKEKLCGFHYGKKHNLTTNEISLIVNEIKKKNKEKSNEEKNDIKPQIKKLKVTNKYGMEQEMYERLLEEEKAKYLRKLIKKDAKAAIDKILNVDPQEKSEKKKKLTNGLYAFVTINFTMEKFNQTEIIKKLEKLGESTWIYKWRAVFEFNTKGGIRPHIHMLIRKSKEKDQYTRYGPLNILSRLASVFGGYILGKESIKVEMIDEISTVIIEQKNNYINGEKKEEKMAYVRLDCEERDKRQMKAVYGEEDWI